MGDFENLEIDEVNKDENLVFIQEEKYPLKEVSNIRWILALIFLNGSFMIAEIFPESIVGAVLFFVGPIIAIFTLGNKAFRKLFHLPKLKDIPAVILTTILLIIVAMISGMVLDRFGAVDNPIVNIISEENFGMITKLLLVQLVIEELFFIVWFLFLYHKVKIGNENSRTLIAWVGSSLVFGAMHLSTYGYNIIQALIGIGLIRFVMSAIYIKRKNLTLAYLVHVLYDLLILASVLAVSSVGEI